MCPSVDLLLACHHLTTPPVTRKRQLTHALVLARNALSMAVATCSENCCLVFLSLVCPFQPGQPDPLELQRQQQARRRALARKRAQEQLRPRTPEPVEGRKHVDVQTGTWPCRWHHGSRAVHVSPLELTFSFLSIIYGSPVCICLSPEIW